MAAPLLLRDGGVGAVEPAELAHQGRADRRDPLLDQPVDLRLVELDGLPDRLEVALVDRELELARRFRLLPAQRVEIDVRLRSELDPETGELQDALQLIGDDPHGSSPHRSLYLD